MIIFTLFLYVNAGGGAGEQENMLEKQAKRAFIVERRGANNSFNSELLFDLVQYAKHEFLSKIEECYEFSFNLTKKRRDSTSKSVCRNCRQSFKI
jgi:hypothetical protein